MSRSLSEIDATSNKASFGHSTNHLIVVKLISEGYCRNLNLLIKIQFLFINYTL